MFDLGWPELGLILVLAVIILGPKELPTAMRTIARWVKRIRGLAREFQGHLDDVVREAELQEVRDGLNKARHMDIGKEIEKTVDPTGDFSRDFDETRRDLDLRSVPRQAETAAEPRPTDDPARPLADAAEPPKPAQPAQAHSAQTQTPAAGGSGSAAQSAAAPSPAPAGGKPDPEPRAAAGGEKGA